MSRLGFYRAPGWVHKNYSGELSVYSKGRTKKEFFVQQMTTGASIFIDGRKIKKAKAGGIYCFHLVDGKIDHFEDCTDWSKYDWRDYAQGVDPAEWCDGCNE